MNEGSRHFEEGSRVHESLRRIARRLDELSVAYAIVGGMALFRHGFRRFTEDVDVLVTREGLKTIHEHLEGRGYLPLFEHGKNLRDTELGVRIEFLVTGQYPGDGKPKPVAFPDPAEVAVEMDTVKYIRLPALIEMKLASGMTSAARGQDLVDVQRLIGTSSLKRDFAEQLHEYVREQYEQLWDTLHGEKKRYMSLWRNKWLTADARSLGDMVRLLRNVSGDLEAMQADELEEMQAAGVEWKLFGGATDGYAVLSTTDPGIAEKYNMHPESEFLDKSDDENE